MTRKTPRHPAAPATGTSQAETDDAVAQEAGKSRTVGRRGLLTRGGAMVAVGAGAAVAATARPAAAATGDTVIQGTVNNVGSNAPATEIQATNGSAPTPTVILTNLGTPATGQASPPLRITPAGSGLTLPSANTVGGDIVATNDGNLWFTHAVPSVGTFPAIVHTDGNSNSFVPLSGPVRILDTRTSAGRAHVLDPSGKFDSAGRLIKGQTIHIDLTSLVAFGDAMSGNLTVTGSLGAGFLTLWSGAIALPNASSINYVKGQTIANLTSSGIFTFGSKSDAIAIACTNSNTHVILDVGGFFVADFGQVNPANVASSMHASSRAARISRAYVRP